jgi:hypothetical protein
VRASAAAVSDSGVRCEGSTRLATMAASG